MAQRWRASFATQIRSRRLAQRSCLRQGIRMGQCRAGDLERSRLPQEVRRTRPEGGIGSFVDSFRAFRGFAACSGIKRFSGILDVNLAIRCGGCMSLRAGLRVFTVFLAAVPLLSPAFSQQKGGRTSGGRIIVSTNWQLSGHVTFEEGTAPTHPVVVESVCNGNVRKETTVDPKGGFSFILGKGSGDNVMNADNQASHGGTGALQNALECVIRASLAGYTSDIINLVGHEEHHPDLGTIILRKYGEGRTESATSKGAPKAAVKAFEKASE